MDIATGFLPLSPVSIIATGYVGKQPVAWKENHAEYYRKAWIGAVAAEILVTEMMLKTALTQAISPFSQCFPQLYILVCQNVALCDNGLNSIQLIT